MKMCSHSLVSFFLCFVILNPSQFTSCIIYSLSAAGCFSSSSSPSYLQCKTILCSTRVCVYLFWKSRKARAVIACRVFNTQNQDFKCAVVLVSYAERLEAFRGRIFYKNGVHRVILSHCDCDCRCVIKSLVGNKEVFKSLVLIISF